MPRDSYGKSIVVPDLRDGYVTVLHSILHNGRGVSPRGYKTWEIEDAQVVIEDPTKLLPVGVGRHPNLAIAAAEAIGLCAGLDVTDLCVSVSKTFMRFLDGSNLWGQYGKRVRGQMETVVRRLREDDSSRQAVVTIWDPAYDQTDARDLPCTLGFGFRIRDGELHMTARMRSQDGYLGLGYDAFFFGQLGHTVANTLNVPLARLTIKQDSLHVYERDVEKIGALQPWDGSEIDEPTGFGYPATENHLGVSGRSRACEVKYEDARRRAERVYNGETIEAPPESDSELWYRKVLAPYDWLCRTANFSS